MIDARSHLIRRPAGVVKVLRLHTDGGHIWPLSYEVHPDEDMCRVCGCTQKRGCAGGCSWVTPAQDLCSQCLKRSMLP